MSITFLSVVPIGAAVSSLLLSRYLRRARSRRCLARLEDALSFDVPRPWHRDMRQALRSADNQLFAVDHSTKRKKAPAAAPQPSLSVNKPAKTQELS